MSLNKQRGQMYPFVSHTWNPIKGRCLHNCPYCYVKSSRAKRYYEGDPYLSEKELKVNLGKNNYIFVGSMTDMWGDWIPREWIKQVLKHCRKYPENKYLFQSKNPIRFLDFLIFLPRHGIFGTTLETNVLIFTKDPLFPLLKNRMYALYDLASYYDKMVSIEPIMQFDLKIMIDWIQQISPKFVVIGADSKGHNLPEPPAEKIRELITELKKFTKVICKKNLDRLLKEK